MNAPPARTIVLATARAVSSGVMPDLRSRPLARGQPFRAELSVGDEHGRTAEHHGRRGHLDPQPPTGHLNVVRRRTAAGDRDRHGAGTGPARARLTDAAFVHAHPEPIAADGLYELHVGATGEAHRRVLRGKLHR